MIPTSTSTVLLAGDTHHDTDWVLHLIDVAVAADVDAIVQVGDFGFFPEQDYGRAFLTAVTARLAQNTMPLLFLDGNHDDHNALRALPVADDGFAYLSEQLAYAPRGSRWTWQGVSFAAAGGAVSVDAASRAEGVNWWREETLSYGEVTGLLDAGPVDVLLTHDAPEQIGIIPSHKSDPASAGHRKTISVLIEQLTPQLLVHGHYHRYHDTTVPHEQGICRVVGLGMNGNPHADRGDGYLILSVADLTLA